MRIRRGNAKLSTNSSGNSQTCQQTFVVTSEIEISVENISILQDVAGMEYLLSKVESLRIVQEGRCSALAEYHRAMYIAGDLEIRVACTDQGDTLSVRVTDNGPGIAGPYREKIFMLFQTLTVLFLSVLDLTNLKEEKK